MSYYRTTHKPIPRQTWLALPTAREYATLHAGTVFVPSFPGDVLFKHPQQGESDRRGAFRGFTPLNYDKFIQNSSVERRPGDSTAG